MAESLYDLVKSKKPIPTSKLNDSTNTQQGLYDLVKANKPIPNNIKKKEVTPNQNQYNKPIGPEMPTKEFLDLFNNTNIDKSLASELIKRGETEKLKSLEKTQKQVSTIKQLPSVAKEMFLDPLGRALLRPAIEAKSGIEGLVPGGKTGTESVNTPFGRMEPTRMYQKQIKEQTGTKPSGLASEAVDVGLTFLPVEKLVAPLLKPLGKALKTAAVKTYEKALHPTKDILKAKSKEVIPELLSKKVTGSIEDIKQTSKIEAKKVGENIGEWWDKLPDGVKKETKLLSDSLENWTNKYKVRGVIVDPNVTTVHDNIATIIKQFGDKVDVKEIRKLKQIWDKIVKKGTKDFTTEATQLKAEALKNIDDTIRDVLSKDYPDLDKLNKEYHFWNNVNDVVSGTNLRKTGQLGTVIKGGGSLIGAYIGSHFGPWGAVVGVSLGKKIADVMTSTSWKTVSAVTKNEIGNALIGKNVINLLRSLRVAGIITKDELREYQKQIKK